MLTCDISNDSYPVEIPSPMSITEKEISSVIKELQPFMAAGSNGIPLFFVK
jgi:hypothetical protein